MHFSCDFETVNDVDDCRVWMWGSMELFTDNFKWGKDIDSFFEWVATKPDGSTIYFHNLKFDGEFDLYYLFRNGFEWVNRKQIFDKEFKTLISDTGVWYAMEFCINDKVYRVIDSWKIISLAVEKIGSAFGLDESKGDIDYNKERPVGYEPDENEISYMYNDVKIVARALEKMFEDGHNSMTQASNAMKFYKSLVGDRAFKKWFPVLSPELDKHLRQAYKGGWSYVNPKFQNVVTERGLVVDNNSIYPHVMYSKPLPYGAPVYFDGKYNHDDSYPIHISTFTCQFELKENHVPTVQLKHTLGFKPTEYVSSSDDEEIALCMTSVDIDLFFKHYDVYNVEWKGGWKFKATDNLFKEYIDHWTKIKIESKESGNKGMYTIAKFFLNMLYGKFGLNPVVQSKMPVYTKHDDRVRYKLLEEEYREPVYVPLASFVTAYAREITITGAQDHFDRFCYADTDSLHMVGWELPTTLELHPTKLGAWDVELYFRKARYIHAKCYIEEESHEAKGKIAVLGRECVCGEPDCPNNGTIERCAIACAGLPKKARSKIGFNDFVTGMQVGGKLQMKRVSGGIVLNEIDFTIKWE